jgi:hypothetical protein
MIVPPNSSQAERIRILDQSTDAMPVVGTVDVSIPCDLLWECFRQAHWWPKWNDCFFWVKNSDLVQDQQLIWAFQPIEWWYLYRMPAWAKIVELVPQRKVTWEVTASPGMYARHTYFLEELGPGRTRFGSWEKAMGPGFRSIQRFWTAHFEFVNRESLAGAQRLETVYRRHGRLDDPSLFRKT